jgi:hypothetical protein
MMAPYAYNTIITKKPRFIFSDLAESLNFEANDSKNTKNQDNNNKQNDNDSDAVNSDNKLDEQLSYLKNDIGGKNDKSVSSNNIDSSNSSQNDNSKELEDMDGMPSSDNAGDFSSNDSFGNDSSGIDDFGDDTSSSSLSGSTTDLQATDDGKANRKLTLYTEYNRVYISVKRSVESLSNITTDNASIKACVAQLQAVLADMNFIMSDFESRTEDDIMIHFTIIEKRISIINEELSRLNTSNSTSKKE